MSDSARPRAAIVDYGMGNLFSVKQACEHVGMDAEITADSAAIMSAATVILPGVGAFADAMETLRRRDLVSVLRDVAASGKSLVGICLGMQLLMTESYEFGHHKGLGIVDGDVVRLSDTAEGENRIKIPHVGWDRMYVLGIPVGAPVPQWRDTAFSSIPNGSYMYFVHSYYTRPADDRVVLSRTTYGAAEFCSSFLRNNVFGCQFHPERSGTVGLEIYRALAMSVMPMKVE